LTSQATYREKWQYKTITSQKMLVSTMKNRYLKLSKASAASATGFGMG